MSNQEAMKSVLSGRVTITPPLMLRSPMVVEGHTTYVDTNQPGAHLFKKSSHSQGNPILKNATGEIEEEKQVPTEEHKVRTIPLRLHALTALSRIDGIITICVMWLCTGLILSKDDKMNTDAAIYILVISCLTTFFEVAWLINKFLMYYVVIEGSCGKICHCFILFDRWRKGLLYVIFAIPAFFPEYRSVETIVCSVLLLITSSFYFMKSIQREFPYSSKKFVDKDVQTTYNVQGKMYPRSYSTELTNMGMTLPRHLASLQSSLDSASIALVDSTHDGISYRDRFGDAADKNNATPEIVSPLPMGHSEPAKKGNEPSSKNSGVSITMTSPQIKKE